MRFVDLLNRLGIQNWTEGKYCRRGWVQFHCPFCFGGLDPNKPYCGYNNSFGYVNCWRCGPHNVGKTLMTLSGMTWREAKEALEEIDAPLRADEYVHTGKLVLPEGREPLLKAHRKYLKKRGFDPDEIESLWRIEGIGAYHRLQWRIFIPIHLHGKTVSWTSRAITDKTSLRYLSAGEEEEAVPHKSLLYGEDYATTAISIHEGPTDVWAIGPGAVATCGTGWSSAQLLRMSKYHRRIVCFDNQPEAQRRAKKLCRLLEPFGETLNVILDAKDAATASEKERKQLRRMLR